MSDPPYGTYLYGGSPCPLWFEMFRTTGYARFGTKTNAFLVSSYPQRL